MYIIFSFYNCYSITHLRISPSFSPIIVQNCISNLNIWNAYCTTGGCGQACSWRLPRRKETEISDQRAEKVSTGGSDIHTSYTLRARTSYFRGRMNDFCADAAEGRRSKHTGEWVCHHAPFWYIHGAYEKSTVPTTPLCFSLLYLNIACFPIPKSKSYLDPSPSEMSSPDIMGCTLSDPLLIHH